MPFGMGMNPMLEDEIKIINERLAKGVALNRYNRLGQTELMVAVEANDIDLAKRLLENKAYHNATTKNGQMDTALHFAAMKRNKELCELLIDKGARVNKKKKLVSLRWTPPFISTKCRDLKERFSNPRKPTGPLSPA
jgi:ankyrin repeat protein